MQFPQADQPGKTAVEVAKSLGIHVGQVYTWRTQFEKLSKRQFTTPEAWTTRRENLVNCWFVASAPYQKWVAHRTYIDACSKGLYLAVLK